MNRWVTSLSQHWVKILFHTIYITAHYCSNSTLYWENQYCDHVVGNLKGNTCFWDSLLYGVLIIWVSRLMNLFVLQCWVLANGYEKRMRQLPRSTAKAHSSQSVTPVVLGNQCSACHILVRHQIKLDFWLFWYQIPNHYNYSKYVLVWLTGSGHFASNGLTNFRHR